MARMALARYAGVVPHAAKGCLIRSCSHTQSRLSWTHTPLPRDCKIRRWDQHLVLRQARACAPSQERNDQHLATTTNVLEARGVNQSAWSTAAELKPLPLL